MAARQAVTGGRAVPNTTPQTQAVIVIGAGGGVPTVKRRWLWGDPWDARFYFAEPYLHNNE